MRAVSSCRVSIDRFIWTGTSILVCGLFFERFPLHWLGLTVFKLAFLVSSFVLILLLGIAKLRIFVPRNPYIYLYFAYQVFTLFFNQTHDNVSYVAAHFQRLLFCIVFITYARNGASVFLDNILVSTGCVACVTSLVLMLLPSLSHSLGLRETTVWYGGIQIPRLTGMSNDPNFTALVISIAFITLLFRLVTCREEGIMGYIKFTLLGSTFLLTLSRGGLLGLLAGVVPVLTSLGNAKVIVALLVIALGGVLTTWMGGLSSWSVMLGRFSATNLHSEPRLVLLRLGLDKLMSSGLWGSGFPAMVSTSQGFQRYLHNTWLEVAVGSGIIGGLLFVLIWVWELRRLCAMERHLKILVGSIMLAVALQMNFLSALGLNLLWLVVLLPEAMELALR